MSHPRNAVDLERQRDCCLAAIRKIAFAPVASCPFCNIADFAGHGRLVASNRHAAAILDGYPVSEGHTLVVPNRHAVSVFDLSGEEQSDVWSLVTEARDKGS